MECLLWAIYCKDFGEIWPCYNSIAMYMLSDETTQWWIHKDIPLESYGVSFLTIPTRNGPFTATESSCFIFYQIHLFNLISVPHAIGWNNTMVNSQGYPESYGVSFPTHSDKKLFICSHIIILLYLLSDSSFYFPFCTAYLFIWLINQASCDRSIVLPIVWNRMGSMQFFWNVSLLC